MEARPIVSGPVVPSPPASDFSLLRCPLPLPDFRLRILASRLFQIPRTTRNAVSHANLFAPRSDLLEVFCNRGELLQGGLKIIRDLLGDDARRGQIG